MGPKSRPEPPQTAPQAHQQPDQRPGAGYGPALQTPGRANADLLTQQQTEVETCDVHQQAFENVRMPAQVHPPHPPRLIQMRKRPTPRFNEAAAYHCGKQYTRVGPFVVVDELQ